MLILHKLFQKIEEKGTCLNSFCNFSITPIPKPDKDIIEKLETNIFYEHKYKSSQQSISKLNPPSYKKFETL